MLSILDHLLFGLIPWQPWLAAGMVGAAAVFIWVPGKLGGALAGGIVCLTLTTSAYSHGEHTGIANERAIWTTKVEAERERLRVAHQAELEAERERTYAAQQDAAERTQERDRAIEQANVDPHAADIVIPESLAASVCRLPGARCGTGPSGSPSGPGKVRRLLLRVRPTAGP